MFMGLLGIMIETNPAAESKRKHKAMATSRPAQTASDFFVSEQVALPGPCRGKYSPLGNTLVSHSLVFR